MTAVIRISQNSVENVYNKVTINVNVNVNVSGKW